MADDGTVLWAAVWIVAGAGALSMLHTLASALRNERFVHDTKVRVAELRIRVGRHLAALDPPERVSKTLSAHRDQG